MRSHLGIELGTTYKEPTVLILGSCSCYSEGKSSNSDLLIPDNSLYYFNPSLFLSYAVSVSMILIHFLIEQRVAQNLTQLKVKGQQFLFFRRKPSLNLIRLLRVVSTPSVTSESTGLTFALIHAKSKTRFSSGKPRNIVCKCLHDTELLYFFRL